MGSIATTVLCKYIAARHAEQLLARRRAARRGVPGLSRYSSIPVEEVSGCQPPRIVGDTWHYETPGGKRVRFPNSYRRVAFSSRLTYVPSEERIEVGMDWLGFGLL
jgi:hypothetical protein